MPCPARLLGGADQLTPRVQAGLVGDKRGGIRAPVPAGQVLSVPLEAEGPGLATGATLQEPLSTHRSPWHLLAMGRLWAGLGAWRVFPYCVWQQERLLRMPARSPGRGEDDQEHKYMLSFRAIFTLPKPEVLSQKEDLRPGWPGRPGRWVLCRFHNATG